MSAFGGGINRSTQHSISFFLLGFESQGLAHAASDPKVPVFSAAVKPRKYPRHIVIHSIFPHQDRECCVDRLNRQPISSFGATRHFGSYWDKSGHLAAMALRCSRRSANLAWRGSSRNGSMRRITPAHRRRGSRSKIRRQPRRRGCFKGDVRGPVRPCQTQPQKP
jgi:hypothetical protein